VYAGFASDGSKVRVLIHLVGMLLRINKSCQLQAGGASGCAFYECEPSTDSELAWVLAR
jgi:hypothetical protein